MDLTIFDTSRVHWPSLFRFPERKFDRVEFLAIDACETNHFAMIGSYRDDLLARQSKDSGISFYHL